MLTYSFSRCAALCAMLVLAVVAAFAGMAPAHAQSPAGIAGVMTRWQTTSKTACQHTYKTLADEPACPRSLMFTITPYLAGLTVHDWVEALTSAGVNTGVIYVMPAYRLAAAATIDDATWRAYNDDIYLLPASLTDSQKQVILQVGEAISRRQYTADQRNYAILAFLAQLQKAFPSSTPIKFILDERVWLINHLNAEGKPIPLKPHRVFVLEQAYSDDIASIVGAAEQQGTGQWLMGVRFSEYATKDWNLIGPVMINLVTQINAKTSGWMKTHLFIGAGGGWGQDFKGVEAMQCPMSAGWQLPPCTGALPFFQYMADQVGYFAFGDKFMAFGKPEQYMLNGEDRGATYTYITGEIAAFCQSNSQHYVCKDPAAPSVKDWQVFLTDDVDGLGFADLIRFMRDNAAEYPKLANVIFEGDNSDSIATMTLPASLNGYTALAGLFRDAAQGRFDDVQTGTTAHGLYLGTWSGKIFLDGFDDTSTVPRPGFYGDAGYSMFDTDYNGFTFEPARVQLTPRKNAMSIWVQWP